jgi:hypothetical protein
LTHEFGVSSIIQITNEEPQNIGPLCLSTLQVRIVIRIISRAVAPCNVGMGYWRVEVVDRGSADSSRDNADGASHDHNREREEAHADEVATSQSLTVFLSLLA